MADGGEIAVTLTGWDELQVTVWADGIDALHEIAAAVDRWRWAPTGFDPLIWSKCIQWADWQLRSTLAGIIGVDLGKVIAPDNSFLPFAADNQDQPSKDDQWSLLTSRFLPVSGLSVFAGRPKPVVPQQIPPFWT